MDTGNFIMANNYKRPYLIQCWRRLRMPHTTPGLTLYAVRIIRHLLIRKAYIYPAMFIVSYCLIVSRLSNIHRRTSIIQMLCCTFLLMSSAYGPSTIWLREQNKHKFLLLAHIHHNDTSHNRCYSKRNIGMLNSYPPGQNGRHFADHIFRCIFVNKKCIFNLQFYNIRSYPRVQLIITQHWFR